MKIINISQYNLRLGYKFFYTFRLHYSGHAHVEYKFLWKISFFENSNELIGCMNLLKYKNSQVWVKVMLYF